MVSDRQLAELMNMATNDDKDALMSMLKTMGAEDKAYFKGYVAGYAEATRHLQMSVGDEEGIARS